MADPTRSGDAIVAEKLTRRFGDFVAVDAVTFSVARGEIFGLLGPNGAGKTTLIRMLTGLLLPTSGRALVAGIDAVRDPAGIRSRIGYMAQLFCLYNDLTVGENLEFFGGLYGLDGAELASRMDWALDMAGLTGDERRMTGDLPLGFKQRLALASAVLHDPPVLFLDEPTSGVDPMSRRNFWRLVEALAARGKAVVVSTHHVEEAEACDRIALMSDGRIIALDRPASLRATLARRMIEVEAVPMLAALGAAESAPGVRHAAFFGRRLHVAADDAENAMRTLPASLSAAGVTVRRVERVEPTLEDAVVALLLDARGAASAGAPTEAR